MIQEILEAIPIEQKVGFLVAVIAAVVGFFAWLPSYIKRVLEKRLSFEDEKRKNDEQAKQLELEQIKRQQEADMLKLQEELDSTQAARNMNSQLLQELVNSRKDADKRDEQARLDFARRDTQHTEALKSIGSTLASFEVIASTQLELLKSHMGSDKAMAENQGKIIVQNDTTHQKIEGLSTKLSAIEDKVESILQSNQNIRQAIIDDIKAELSGVKLDIQHLEALITAPKTIFDAPPTVTVTTAVNTVNETKSEDKPNDSL